jgi:hypothetical protein
MQKKAVTSDFLQFASIFKDIGQLQAPDHIQIGQLQAPDHIQIGQLQAPDHMRDWKRRLGYRPWSFRSSGNIYGEVGFKPHATQILDADTPMTPTLEMKLENPARFLMTPTNETFHSNLSRPLSCPVENNLYFVRQGLVKSTTVYRRWDFPNDPNATQFGRDLQIQAGIRKRVLHRLSNLPQSRSVFQPNTWNRWPNFSFLRNR